MTCWPTWPARMGAHRSDRPVAHTNRFGICSPAFEICEFTFPKIGSRAILFVRPSEDENPP